MLSELSAWKRKHKEKVDFGSFRNRLHPINKQKYPDKTVYFCLKCREAYTDLKPNKISPAKPRILKKIVQESEHQKALKRLDKIWIKIITLRAGGVSEYSGRGAHTFDFLDAHHIAGKSTLALRYDIQNGVLITRKEHSELAHSMNADTQKEFKEWALDLRSKDKEKPVNNFEFGSTELEEVEAYLKENLHILTHGHKPVDQEVYFP